MNNIAHYKKLLEDLENLPKTEKEWIIAVSKQPYLIKHHPNPSEEVQLAAVKTKGSAIQNIKNPSEQVQLAAVKKYGAAIQYIDNPSVNVQLAAVKKNSYALNYIKNPSKRLWLDIVTKHGFDPSKPHNVANKKQLISWMLGAIKSSIMNDESSKVEFGFICKHMYAYLEKQGIIWPELKAIEQSIIADR